MKIFSHGQYAKSSDASFISIDGAEAIDFLQSILTAMDFDTRIIGLDLTSENKSEQPDSN